MTASARTIAILREIAPVLEQWRKTHGYYPPCPVIRSMIADSYGDKVSNTIYRKRMAALIQQYVAPLYSGPGAREYAAVAGRLHRQPLQGFDWWGGHASPFASALDWLWWRLERLTVGGEVRARSDLRIVRTDDSEFKVYHGRAALAVQGTDYAHAVAGLLLALVFDGTVQKQVHGKLKRPGRKSIFGTLAVL